MTRTASEALIKGVLGAPAEIGDRMARASSPIRCRRHWREALEQLQAEMAADLPRRSRPRGFRAGVARRPRSHRLRRELAARGLDGFVVPRSDEHQGEYVPPRGQRLAWLTGFTGSAGLAVVLRERAALFVDGRYTLQAAQQVDAQSVRNPSSDRRAAGALARQCAESRRRSSATIPGCTRRKKSSAFAPPPKRPAPACAPSTATRSTGSGTDQPAAPLAPVVPHADAFAGESAQSKRARLARGLAEEGVAAAVLTMPESIAWLLNIRGGDVPHTPLPLSFAILRNDAQRHPVHRPAQAGARPRTPSRQRRDGLPPEQLGPALDALAAEGGRVQVDPATAAAWIFDRLEAAGAKIHRAADPCLLPKACKNTARDRRHPRRASPRRRGADPLSGLARARGAQGRPDRDRRQRPARSLSPRGRIFPRSELSDDLRRRLEWRDRALPGDAGDREAARTRHASICSIPARNISTAPPT